MRTIFCISLVMLLSIFTQSNSTAQNPRGALWVHGLNSNNFEWNKWENLFVRERQLQDRNSMINGGWQNYRSENGVLSMADAVLADRANGGGDNQTIYFGKSMGGVVGREIDVNRSRNFGGIITAGSPLDGARIANSSRSGEASTAIFDGSDIVLRGPTRQLGPIAGFSFEILGIYAVSIVRFFDSFFDIYKFRDYNNRGVTDLMEGSDYMNSGIRNVQTNTPKVLIYGNENAPGCWRLMSQAVGNGDDEQYVNVARTAGDVYEAAMWVNYGIAAGYTIAAFFSFGATAWEAAYFAWVAVGWMDGMNWWRYDSDRIWNSLIGANTIASNTVCYQQLDYQGLNQCLTAVGPGATYNDYMRCQQQNTRQLCYTYYASVNTQSDAFIRASSASGFNSAWANNATRIEAQGVNHVEMEKHPRMGEIYNQILDGSGVPSFFQTARK